MTLELSAGYHKIPVQNHMQRIGFLAGKLDEENLPFVLRRLREIAEHFDSDLKPASDDFLIKADEKYLFQEHLSDIYNSEDDEAMVDILCGMAERCSDIRENVTRTMQGYITCPSTAIGDRLVLLCDLLSFGVQAILTAHETQLVFDFVRTELKGISSELFKR